MKKLLRYALCLLALAGLSALTGPAARAEAAELSEWTVMMYMCGSDLESQNALASYNLREIASMWFPSKVAVNQETGIELVDWQAKGVNVLVETGGARQWHSMEMNEKGLSLGVDIATDRLQRYAFEVAYDEEQYGFKPKLELVDEQPLASMSAPETLSDFIQWAQRSYPAKKYMLLLWDHGGGSRTGLFVDELFDNDVMYLYQLEQALAGGGVYFELVAIDACLMCSLETAQILAPYANFMVASEEVAAGYGSAFSEWMYELYRDPGCNGQLLGCEFCDAAQRKYAEKGDTLSETQLTYSLIDLEYIDEVGRGFNRLFEYVGRLYESMPTRFNVLFNYLSDAERYGTEDIDMIDIGSFLYNEDTISLLDADCRNALASALDNAVSYNIKGSGRSKSKGLSFCFAPEMTPEELDIYEKNCKNAPYLALLDAVNADWSAPDWVYESTRRLTQIEEIPDYRLGMELSRDDHGLPRLKITNQSSRMLNCKYNLYFEDEDTGQICELGNTVALVEVDREAMEFWYAMDTNGHWPTMEGEPCCAYLIDLLEDQSLYNVPVQIGTNVLNLRMMAVSNYDEDSDELIYEYEAIGLWQGYNKETRMPSRSVISFNQMQGQEFRLLYPVNKENDAQRDYYITSAPLTLYRSIEVEYAPLPVGTYYCSFTVEDIFKCEYETELVELYWDGSEFTAAE